MYNFAELEQQLRKNIVGKRVEHSISVMHEMERLAKIYGLDREKAKLAGLLHDCGREIKLKEAVSFAEKNNISVDNVERSQTVLLHGKIGLYIAENKFGIIDEEVLQAIALHTTGGANMSELAKALFIADMIEPLREYPEAEIVRKYAVGKSLSAIMLKAYECKLEDLLVRQRLIHPQSVEGYNFLLQERDFEEQNEFQMKKPKTRKVINA